jgi:hypothetical protein
MVLGRQCLGGRVRGDPALSTRRASLLGGELVSCACSMGGRATQARELANFLRRQRRETTLLLRRTYRGLDTRN